MRTSRLLLTEVQRGLLRPNAFAPTSLTSSSVASARIISTGSGGVSVPRSGAPSTPAPEPVAVTEQQRAGYRTWHPDHGSFSSMDTELGGRKTTAPVTPLQPGSLAFADCEYAAVRDLFHDFAKNHPPSDGGVDEGGSYLCASGVRDLLASIGECSDDDTVRALFCEHDVNGDERLHLEEFLAAADDVLSGAPARIVLVVGGPGSGKGLLCDRLQKECAVVHMSSGDLLRGEVERDTPLGRECAAIMGRGELVSSAVITALVRRRMRDYPGRRVLLDGFPRSLENATDFMQLCGTPEVALHLDCDDTILMERIINRGKQGDASGARRADDNIDTALTRLRTFHKYHRATMEWLREQHVPVVNLDCSGTPENVWQQLLAIGRLMRPVANPKGAGKQVATATATQGEVGIFGLRDEPAPAPAVAARSVS